MPFRLPKTVRTISRLQTIARVLTQHGFGHVVERIDLGRYVPFGLLRRTEKAPAEPTDPDVAVGKRLASVCSELGPTFVKLGQTLSSRPDLLPASVINELRTLQDKVPPFDSKIAAEIIAEELGAPPAECFASLESEPFASGSIAQVHRATAKDGTKLVVKVRRPDVESVVSLDMQILRWLAEASERLLPELAVYKPTAIVDEFENTMIRELDFINEAAATNRFADSFAEDETVHIPAVRWELTGSRVLTMEAIPGKNLDVLLASGDGYIDRKLLARNIGNLFLRQFFELNFFHADPHPGNLLITPPARIGLIDFGMVGRISEALSGHLAIALVAVVNKDVEVLVDVMADMHALQPETDRNQLARDLHQLLDKYYSLPLKRFDLQTVFYELNAVVQRNHAVFPHDFVMLTKSLVTIAGTVLKLDPELNLIEMVKPRIRQLMMDQFSPRRMMRHAGVSMWHIVSLLKSAPRQVRDLLRRISDGQWQMKVQHENIEQMVSEMDRTANRLSFSIVIAAIIVGSSVVVSGDTSVHLFGIPLWGFGIVGYLVAGILGLGLLWAIFRSGRLH